MDVCFWYNQVVKSGLKDQAIRLRLEQNLGYASIAKLISVSKSTLSNWLKNYPLTDERIKELRRLNLKNNDVRIETFRNRMRLKREIKFREVYERQKLAFREISRQSRFISGLVLYLAEGSKKDDYHISIANTDPAVIRFFMKWADEFLNIDRKSFRIQLHLYLTMDIGREERFWQNTLEIGKNQFYKHQIRRTQKGSFTYRESFRHGTCQVYFSSSEKKRELMAAIKAFVDSFLK